jgi:hypothetical protein
VAGPDCEDTSCPWPRPPQSVGVTSTQGKSPDSANTSDDDDDDEKEEQSKKKEQEKKGRNTNGLDEGQGEMILGLLDSEG